MASLPVRLPRMMVALPANDRASGAPRTITVPMIRERASEHVQSPSFEAVVRTCSIQHYRRHRPGRDDAYAASPHIDEHSSRPMRVCLRLPGTFE